MFFTDLLASIACVYGAFIILYATRKSNALKTYWALFFVFCSISFLTSALSHTLQTAANSIKLLSRISWSFAIAGVTSFAVGVGSAGSRVKQWYINVIWAFCLACILFVAMGINFTWVVIYCFAAMFLTILINSSNKIISFKYQYSKGILIGTSLYVLAAVAYLLFRNLNQLDIRPISHIILAIGIIVFANSCKKTVAELTKIIKQQKKTAYTAAKKST